MRLPTRYMGILALLLCLPAAGLDAKETISDTLATRYEQHALTQAGDAAQGKKLFRSDRLKCSMCHRVGQNGGQIGPELSSIGGKFDRPHLIESLLQPSRQIVTGYRTTALVLNDGTQVQGIVREEGDGSLRLADNAGKLLTVRLDDIESRKETDVSLMPEGFEKELSIEQFTDLIAYLESLRSGIAGNPGSAVRGPVTLPADFKVSTVLTGLTGATAMETLPDGRLLICDQTGSVRIVEDGKLLKEPLVTLPVDSSWERGVIGVTIDPEFPRQPYVYVSWVAKAPYPHHRISRFELDGNVAQPGSELVLIAGDDQRKLGGKVKNGHQGGALHFGKDGCLYIALGEQTAGKPSQNLDSLLGKILRITRDGKVPADNPLLEETRGKYRAIWAYGLRNPFTFAVNLDNGQMLINDVGGKFEEINVGVAGANYGWPTVNHGPTNRPGYTGPVHWYPEASISGGDFVPVDSPWPESWQGKYLFADFKHGWIHAIDPADGQQPTTFGSGFRRPVDLRFDASGTLYVLQRNAWVIDAKFQPGTGSLLRIERK